MDQSSIKVSLGKDKKTLIVEVPLTSPPTPSASGKTLVVASTRGNFSSDLMIDGKPVKIGVNAYINK